MENKALYLFCFSIFPLMVCSGMVYSILAIYLNQQLGATVTMVGFIYMVGSASGAIFSPTVGKLSDKFGRRRILILSMFGFMIAFSAYAIIQNASQAILIQALEGATWAAMSATAMAFIADLVPSEKRGWAMGVYDRTWFVGWVVGPILGGYLADTFGFRITFLVGAILTIVGLLLMVFYVREVKNMQNQTKT